MKKAMLGCTWISGVLTVFFLFFPSGIGKTLAITAGTTFYHFIMRLIVGYCVPALRKNLNPDGWWFRQRKWEHKLYRFLQVRKWKKYLPTYNPEAFDAGRHTTHELILTMCQSELVHEWIMLLSFLPLLMVTFFGSFLVFFLTSLFASFFDSLFVVIQRFNRPRVQKILRNQYSTNSW